jgi:hypothetical protein
LRRMLTNTVFASSFTEGDPVFTSQETMTSSLAANQEYPERPFHRRIQIEDDYDLFHNVLYYIYTDRIYFTTDLSFKPASEGAPNPCSAEELYSIADRLLLTDLKLKAIDFLRLTCSPENITSRILSKFAYLHDDIRKAYEGYFQDNWHLIKHTSEYHDFFAERLLEEDIEELVRIIRFFRDIMKDAVFRTS